ncbi:MAG: chromate transporter [Treponema sp.]|nr:chromate transporter [Treponema sp.]
MSILGLFFVFFYIGLFAVGGGLVAATFMQQALVEQYHLITEEQFYAMLAISESTPGPVGINLATYIGTELHGIPGGIIATFGEVLPSLIVIVIIAKFFSKFQEKPLVKSIFSTLRPVTSGLVLIALVRVFAIALVDFSAKAGGYFIERIREMIVWPAVSLYIVCLVILFRTKLHPVVIVLLGGIFGVLFLGS